MLEIVARRLMRCHQRHAQRSKPPSGRSIFPRRLLLLVVCSLLACLISLLQAKLVVQEPIPSQVCQACGGRKGVAANPLVSAARRCVRFCGGAVASRRAEYLCAA